MPRDLHPLRQLRQDDDMTREQLSAYTTVPYRTIERVEAGHNVMWSTAFKLAQHFGVPVEDILVPGQEVILKVDNACFESYGLKVSDNAALFFTGLPG